MTLMQPPNYVILGAVGYETLSAAITTIGSTTATLVIPPGTQTITSQLIFPANITLKFESGAKFDLTGLLDADIEGMSKAASCQVTVTGHGLTGSSTYMRFYKIRQCYVSGATHNADWMTPNNGCYQATRIDNDNFTVAVNSSAYTDAYNAATDPGRVCVPIIIEGPIIADKNQQIFEVDGPQVVLGRTANYFANNKQVDSYPEWFGAVGDGATDDLKALNAARDMLIYGDLYVRGTIWWNKNYAVSDTFSLVDFGTGMNGSLNIQGKGKMNCGLVSLSGCNGKPLMEILGVPYLHLRDFQLIGRSRSVAPTDAPSVAMCLARSQRSANAGGSFFDNIGFFGYYQYGYVFNYGYATSTWSNLESAGSALTGEATNYWSFNFYNGSGDDAGNPFPGIVPTNSDFRTGTNCSADGNLLRDTYWVTYGTKAAGNASIWQRYSITLEGVASGNLYDYIVYSNCAVYINRCSGDGGASIAGVYLYSANPNTNIGGYIKNFVDSLSSDAVVLKTDTNTRLLNMEVNSLRGSNGFKIELGNGAMDSYFLDLYTMNSFVVSAGALTGCTIEVPYTCANLSIPSGGYNNIIRKTTQNSRFTVLDGDVRYNWPSATPSNVYNGPYNTTWAAAAPTSGSWSRGSVIWNTAPSAGGSPGWVCIENNTFGTLNSGNTTATTDSTATIQVNSITGLSIGNWIDIATATGGPFRVVNIDATLQGGTYYNVYLHTAVTNSVTGQAVSFHNHTTADAFKLMNILI